MSFELDFDGLEKSEIKSLYKFKTFDEKGFYKDILNNFIYLASRKILNDPEDCRVPLEYELCTDEEIKDRMYKYLSERISGTIRNIIVENQFLLRRKNPDYYKNALEKSIDKSLGIFSLTGNLSEEMWGKYSDYHRGFCIEYDAKILGDELNYKFEKTGIKIFIFNVIYSDEIFVINPCRDTLDQKALMFLVKTSKWSYENEWRIVHFEGSNKKEPLNKNCVKNVYFGKDADLEKIKSSIEMLKISNPGIGIFIGKLKNNTLTYEQIN